MQMNAKCILGFVFLFFNYFVIENLQKEPFRLKLVQSMFLFTFCHLVPACSKVQTVGNVRLGGASERRPLGKMSSLKP